MRKYLINCGTTTCRYALFGIVFGFCFPVVAISFDVILHFGKVLNLDSIIFVHNKNPIHYIVDTAPIFLGVAFGVAGYYQEKGRKLNRSLRQQAENLEDTNTSLVKAIDDFQIAQNLLVKSEKLASLGQLTAGIAHELRNPLNFITNFSESGTELLDELDSLGQEEERKEIIDILKENFDIIHQHGMRANNILESMMTLARSGNVEKRLSDINLVCKDASDVSYHGMSSNIMGFKCDFQKFFTPGLPKIVIVYEDISRVILNILTNAFYAVNQKKENVGDKYIAKVILTTGISQPSPVNGQTNILITIRDNGTGMPPEVREKIFNPFFTTKPSGEGTGLGLSISHDIILVHGGTISVTSEENEFTEFLIELPVNNSVE